MAQYKSGDPGVPPFVVENGSQTVVIPGVDARTDIPFSADRPPYFREQETGPTYEVASAPQYTGGDTVVTLTGAWQGDSGEIDGLFHVDFSANMGYPLFYSGDIDIPDILRRWVVGLDDDMYGLIVGAITDHNDLDGRDASGAHPISAISGLQAALDGKFDADGAHNDLSGRGDPDAHPISAISGLQEALDQAITEHNDLGGRSESDAHPIAAITGLQAALDAKFNQVDAGELAAGNDASDVPVSGLSAPFDSAENVQAALALLGSAAGRDVGTDPDNMPDIEIADARYARLAGGAAANFAAPPQIDGQGMDDRYVIALSGTTGTAIFDRASNSIQRSGIVTALGLEPGDVIEIAGTNDNNNIYTVEHVISDDAVEVNRAHSNGAGPLSLTDETNTATITSLSKWYNAPLGLGQAWVDVAPSRAFDTNYTNTTGRAFAVSVTTEDINNAARVFAYVDGVMLTGSGIGGSSAQNFSRLAYIFFVVPPGSAYSATSPRNLDTWTELR